jgi:uncharacterized protein
MPDAPPAEAARSPDLIPERLMADTPITRRDFVKTGTLGTAGLVVAGGAAATAATAAGQASVLPPPMPERPLGRTGHNVRIFSLGGQATIEREGTRDEAVAIINRALDLGVNYIDTAAAYGRGISERYIGEVMATRRREVFLATKTHDRTRDGSLRLLEQSLRQLRTDRIDLWQVHNITTTAQLDQVFGPGGAMEALQQAQSEGIVRFLGISGHADPGVLIEGINRFDFDAILLALNPADRYHLPFMNELLPLANRKQMGVIAMKLPARGRMFRPGGITSIKPAMEWTLSQPVSTCIIGVDDIAQLEENVAVAAQFQPLNSAQMAAIEGMVAGYVADAAWFKRGAAGVGQPDAPDDQQMDA